MESINTEHGIFTKNEITEQTAEEVYQEWLENKDKPPQPSETETVRSNRASYVGNSYRRYVIWLNF